ncbi:hypothetical protein ACFSOZ_26330 [Mesorhizobium newzealandense]|uniref:Uncharacterized protein n=1 Tax=Mesorhizobium newzealandense TaxID=1300302 RepID=A0ABW4UFS2_9HYPH
MTGIEPVTPAMSMQCSSAEVAFAPVEGQNKFNSLTQSMIFSETNAYLPARMIDEESETDGSA